MKPNWGTVNLKLIAKSIGELTFEQILGPVRLEDSWILKLSSGVVYTFKGWMTTYEHLRVDPNSITKNNALPLTAAHFFLDTQEETGMSDITLANFFEEMNNTLVSDMNISEINVQEMASWDGDTVQVALNGHPKILLNKGRIGWDKAAHALYAPESNVSFKLHWLAVKKSVVQGSVPELTILDESFDPSGKSLFLESAQKLIPNFEHYTVLPVHPWQWQRFISLQFAEMIALKEIIYLGEAGDLYRPQISIRTLSNVSRKEKNDIKLPLSILNTSCIRGLPAESVIAGKEVSEVLDQICKEDEKLNHVEILKETAGMTVGQRDFLKIKSAPYRYHEYLGAVWRESSFSKLGHNEKAILSASLFHQDHEGKSLIGQYIKNSGLETEEWLKRYFEVVVIPLYHFQIKYGVGMVAHGQNIVLKMKNDIPVGMFLKDFQGDLRLNQRMPESGLKYFQSLQDKLTKLPSHYLIHDLITGHFITVLRFLSGSMQESDHFSENQFYKILSQVIQGYYKENVVDEMQSLLTPKIQRVLLNKVRFAIGYSDSSERPLPKLGTELKNPLDPKNWME